MMNLADDVDPMAVRTAAVDIASDQPSANGGTFHCHQIAELHRYVNENITYVPDPNSTNYVAPPDETLEVEAGDCDCQAVLLASLFEAIGARTRIVLCESTGGDWHALAQVCLADSRRDATKACNSLSSYYSSNGITTSEFSWNENSGQYWFLADTAAGEYIGDRRLLSDNGFIQESDDSWAWYNSEYHYPDSTTKQNNTSEKYAHGIAKKVEEEFDRLPSCNNWWGEASLHHSDFGEEWSCCCSSSNPSTIREYLAEWGFDVASDDTKYIFYIKKSDYHYIVFDGCLDIAGHGPHQKCIRTLIKDCLDAEAIITWESRSIKIADSNEGISISVVDQDGRKVPLSDRYTTPDQYSTTLDTDWWE
jgi:hypothetical protein